MSRKALFLGSFLVPSPFFCQGQNTHPDNKILQPSSEKRQIGIAQVQSLQQWALLKPYQRQFKGAFIYPADALTREAQNSLLKLLEEPPSQTAFFLLTRQRHQLLPTIRSRCQFLSWIQFKEKVSRYFGLEFEPLSPSKLEKEDLLQQFLKALDNPNLATAFSFWEKLARQQTRTTLITFLEKALIYLYHRYFQQQQWHWLPRLGELEKARFYLTRNSNTRIILENLYLNWHSFSLSAQGK